MDKLWSSNGSENLVYDRSDNSVSKYVHEFEYNSNADKIRAMVDVVMILDFPKFDNSFARKLKIRTTSTTAHISSAFELYLNSCTYLETELCNLSYSKFSDP